MKIVKAQIEVKHIEAPNYDPISDVNFTAAVCDDGGLMLVYMEVGGKSLVMAFNRHETAKIRSALNKGG